MPFPKSCTLLCGFQKRVVHHKTFLWISSPHVHHTFVGFSQIHSVLKKLLRLNLISIVPSYHFKNFFTLPQNHMYQFLGISSGSLENSSSRTLLTCSLSVRRGWSLIQGGPERKGVLMVVMYDKGCSAHACLFSYYYCTVDLLSLSFNSVLLYCTSSVHLTDVTTLSMDVISTSLEFDWM